MSAALEAETDQSVPVYFDCKFIYITSLFKSLIKWLVFKSIILVFPISRFLTLNIIALVVIPIVLALFALCEYFLAKHDERPRASGSRENVPFSRRYFQRLSGAAHLDGQQTPENPQASPYIRWLEIIWRHVKFWVALGITIALQYLLIWSYVLFNPFVSFRLPFYFPHLTELENRPYTPCLTTSYWPSFRWHISHSCLFSPSRRQCHFTPQHTTPWHRQRLKLSDRNRPSSSIFTSLLGFFLSLLLSGLRS